MKRLIFGLVFFISPLYCQDSAVPASAVTVDGIEAVVFGQSGLEIVTKSDVMRPSLAGVARTKDDIIFERLVFLDAQKFHVVPDEEAVDRYLASIQQDNNLTLDQLKEIFHAAGYTYEEGREQFKRLQTVNSMFDFKVRAQLVVPRNQVEEYYKQHPVEQEASYQLQYGRVPFKGDSQDQKKEIQQRLADNREPRGVLWQDPFWINESEIAEDKMFITKLNAGQVAEPLPVEDGFELYKVIEKKDKRVAPLEERYREIVDILRRPKYEELMQKYRQQLFDSTSIIYMDK